MEQEFEILLPYMRCEQEEETEVFKKDYKLSGAALNALHRRGRERLQELLPQWTEDKLMEQIRWVNREVEALWESPYAYALLVTADTMDNMKEHSRIIALSGAWKSSLYAYLMGLTYTMPQKTEVEAFIREPVILEINPEDEPLCREAILWAAWELGFTVLPRGEDSLALLPAGQREHPDAPIIRIHCAGRGK